MWLNKFPDTHDKLTRYVASFHSCVFEKPFWKGVRFLGVVPAVSSGTWMAVMWPGVGWLWCEPRVSAHVCAPWLAPVSRSSQASSASKAVFRGECFLCPGVMWLQSCFETNPSYLFHVLSWESQVQGHQLSGVTPETGLSFWAAFSAQLLSLTQFCVYVLMIALSWYLSVLCFRQRIYTSIPTSAWVLIWRFLWTS